MVQFSDIAVTGDLNASTDVKPGHLIHDYDHNIPTDNDSYGECAICWQRRQSQDNKAQSIQCGRALLNLCITVGL